MSRSYFRWALNVYLDAQTFIYQPEYFYTSPHIFLLSLRTFWCPHKHFGVSTENYLLCENIFQPPEKYLVSPKIYCVSCADLLVPSIFGMPICLNYVMILDNCWQLRHYRRSFKYLTQPEPFNLHHSLILSKLAVLLSYI